MFYKTNENGYIRLIGTGEQTGGGEITETEYNELREIIRKRPTAPEGYGYRLTESLEWELYELPAVEDTDEELSDSEALDIIVNGGGGNA